MKVCILHIVYSSNKSLLLPESKESRFLNKNFVLKLYKNGLNYLNILYRGETLL